MVKEELKELIDILTKLKKRNEEELEDNLSYLCGFRHGCISTYKSVIEDLEEIYSKIK